MSYPSHKPWNTTNIHRSCKSKISPWNCKISFFFSSVICWSSLLCKLAETSTGALGGQPWLGAQLWRSAVAEWC